MDVINKETIVKETKDEQEDARSTDSKESKDSNNGKKETKWTDFRKRKNNKKAPKLLHSLSFPSPSNKPFLVSSPSFPDLIGMEKNEKQDSERFHGDGVNFKAKLIGIKEVGQPRGDRLAQDALHELKASVKASNTHKQKILINVALEGIKIKDEKGNVMHHHPVHKISFIAQDITDPRAFGYVFGSPTLGHKFFAIKTEKAAQQLVIAMRDLFHVVFELRKKELENRTNLSERESQALTDDEKEIAAIITATENVNIGSTSNIEEMNNNISSLPNNTSSCPFNDAVDTPHVNNLLDLDISNESSATQKSPVFEDDFFTTSASDKNNDPFFADPLNFISTISPSLFTNTDGPFFVDGDKKGNAENNINPFSTDSFVTSDSSRAISDDPVRNQVNCHLGKQSDSGLEEKKIPVPLVSADKYAPLLNLTVVENKFEILDLPTNVELIPKAGNSELIPKGDTEPSLESSNISPSKSTPTNDFFSDLDPLGKDRPFIDKKDFFHDVKNPPKKVLKDLVGESQLTSVLHSTTSPSADESAKSFVLPCVSQFPVNFSSESSPSLLPLANSNKEIPPSLFIQHSKNTNSESPSLANPFKKSVFTNAANAFDDPFFSEEFHFPSPPSNPPPPLPPTIPQVSSTTESPVPPPRPPSVLPPPLPPKRQLPPTTPLIKLVPLVESKHEIIDDEDTIITNNNPLTVSKSAGTLPIPIPMRKSVGRSSANLSISSSRSNGSIGISSPSPSSISMSSVNGTSYGSNSPTCPPNSLSDIFSVSSNSSYINSSKSDLECKKPDAWVNGSIREQSPPVNNCPKSSVSPFLDIKFDSLSNGFNHQVSSKVVIISNNDKNNNYNNHNGCNNFINNENEGKCMKQWNVFSSKTNETSIFRRETDPFADEFFTSLTTKNSLNNVFEIKNNANQAPRVMNPFTSE